MLTITTVSHGYFGQSKHHHRDSTPEFYRAEINSQSGKTIMESENGEINSTGAKFLAKQGTKMLAQKDIHLFSDIGVSTSDTSKSVSNTAIKTGSNHSRDEIADPTLIAATEGEISVKSLGGNLHGRGAMILGGPEVDIILAGKKIILEKDVTDHHYESNDWSVNVTFPGSQMLAGAQNDNLVDGIVNEDPALQNARDLAQSDNDAERAINGANTFNAMRQAAEQSKKGATGLLDRYASAGVGVSQTKVKKFHQQAQNGVISRAKTLQMIAEEELDSSINIHDIDTMKVKAKKVHFHSTKLRHESSTSNNTATATVNAAGQQTYGGSHHHENGSGEQHELAEMTGIGHTQIDAKDLIMEGAKLETETISGQVDKFTKKEVFDEHHSTSEGYGADTSGNMSLSKGKNDSKLIHGKSGMHIKKGMNHEPDKQFKVGEYEHFGHRGITSYDPNNTNFESMTENVISHEIEEYDKREGYHLRANPNALASGDATTVQVGVDHKDYRATHNEQGKQVKRNSKIKAALDIPFAKRRPQPDVPAIPSENTGSQEPREKAIIEPPAVNDYQQPQGDDNISHLELPISQDFSEQQPELSPVPEQSELPQGTLPPHFEKEKSLLEKFNDIPGASDIAEKVIDEMLDKIPSDLPDDHPKNRHERRKRELEQQKADKKANPTNGSKAAKKQRIESSKKVRNQLKKTEFASKAGNILKKAGKTVTKAAFNEPEDIIAEKAIEYGMKGAGKAANSLGAKTLGRLFISNAVKFAGVAVSIFGNADDIGPEDPWALQRQELNRRIDEHRKRVFENTPGTFEERWRAAYPDRPSVKDQLENMKNFKPKPEEKRDTISQGPR